MADQGVTAGSRAYTYDTYAIFCVGNDIIKEAAFKATCADKLLGYKPLYGCYEGKTERSFIMNWTHKDFILEFTKQEESILLLGPMQNLGGGKMLRPATLRWLTAYHEENLGYFTEVGKEHALAERAWTFDPSTGKYWVCKHL